MIPILFHADADPVALLDVNSVPLFDVNGVQLLAYPPQNSAREFDSYGKGALVDCIKCEVTEERNGAYELEMEYPITGAHFDDIELRDIIWAKPNYADAPQAFRIYFMSTPIEGVVTITARHLIYDLSGIPVVPFTATSASAACAGLLSHALVESPFQIGTQIGTIADFKVDVPSSVRSWFGGKEGSLIDVYGGEWAYDNYTATLKAARGQDRGVVIRYGKNLIDFEQENNCEEVYTGVLAYWADDEGHQVRTNIINVAGDYSFRRILVLDLSAEYEEQPTKAQLTTRAQTYIEANNIGVPKVNITLDWVQTSELDGRVDLCDTVLVKFELIGVSAKAKCISTTWDVLKDRYSRIEFGDPKTNITDTIAGMQEAEKKQETSVSNAMLRAIGTATALITGNSGGYVVMHDSDDDGEPDEILIMDTDDISTATKVWRWNKNGLGYSSSGYNGSYALAITANGQIVADFITTGTLSADRIYGGTINGNNVDVTNLNASNISSGALSANYINGGTLKLGGANNGNGTMNVFNSSNALSIQVNNVGVTAIDTSDSYFSRLASARLVFCKSDGTVIGAVRRYTVSSGYGVEVYGANGVQIQSGEQMQIKAGDGIWITTGSRQLFVQSIYNTTISSAANVYVNNLGALYRSTSSSKRYKEGITEDLADLDPEVLYKLPVVRFKFKDGYISADDERAGKDVIGFIAEDVDELYPIAVRHEDGKAEMWESNYMIPAMMKLIQNQKKEIDELRERLDRLEARL